MLMYDHPVYGSTPCRIYSGIVGRTLNHTGIVYYDHATGRDVVVSVTKDTITDTEDPIDESLNMSLASRAVYLAGPIDHCTHDEMWGWRMLAKEWLYPIHCFNPCNRHFDISGGHTAEISKQVVTLDKAEIAASDALLVWYNQPAVGSKMTGTTMEIIHAFERGKLVVLVTKEPNVSSWIDYHTHVRFSELEPATKYIKEFYNR
jgi:nucleoside 2-deoxyribosyltransferase